MGLQEKNNMNNSIKTITLIILLGLSGCGFQSLQFPWSQRDEKSDMTWFLHSPSPPPAVPLTQSQPLIIRRFPTSSSYFNSATPEQFLRCKEQLGLSPIKEVMAHDTNYGERHTVDFEGRQLISSPQLIVLHETVSSGLATLNNFKTAHPRDENQASYHMLIEIDGSLIRVVPDNNRAYGAGMSAFGDFTQRIKANSVGSINNVALHIGLVSPADGRGNGASHSGYSNEQYSTLAKQVLLWQAKYGIPMTRVTTHFAVDRSHSRYDPRSFNWNEFDKPYKEASNRCGFNQYDHGQAGL